MPDSHSRVEAAIKAFANGEIVVVTDDDDRENEGDLFVAASHCTPEKMAFIIRNTSGIVCAPLGADQARRLHLEPMVAANEAPLGTAFTVSVDVRHGLTTGISADERCNTVRALANDNNGAADFVRPGHVFPLVAREGGVLMRSGHTEACVDLCRLASLPPVGVLAELMNDNGSVMRGPEVTAFAHKHKLTQVSIAELIAYRQRRDKLVERVGAFSLASEIGTLHGYAYVTPFDRVHHMAFVYGTIGDGNGVLAGCIERTLLATFSGARERSVHRLRDLRQLDAELSFICEMGRPACRWPRFHMATPEPMRPVRGNGAKSGWARKFSRTSAFPLFACSPPASALTLVSEALALRLWRPSQSRADLQSLLARFFCLLPNYRCRPRGRRK